jgi:hypothetical protein
MRRFILAALCSMVSAPYAPGVTVDLILRGYRLLFVTKSVTGTWSQKALDIIGPALDRYSPIHQLEPGWETIDIVFLRNGR